MSQAGYASFHRGRIRSGGALPALDPARLSIDGRSLAQMIAMAPEYARLLAFADPAAPAGTDWSPFFEHDILFLLAQIATFDAAAHGQASDKPEQRMHALAATVDSWRVRAAQIDFLRHPARSGSLSQALADALPPLAALLDAAPGGREARQALGPAWDNFAPLASWQAGGPDRLYQLFCELIGSLARPAQAWLQQELFERQDHAPHSSLYVAFLQVQQIVQADLNGFSERHLRYYYETVLRLTLRPAVPDTAHVMFELNPQVPRLTLAAGTLLKAGKDANGADLLYATRGALDINQAVLDSVMTLFVEHSKVPDSAVKWVGAVHAAKAADSADGQGAALDRPALGWPTFGTAAPAGGADTGFGFLLGSPVLLLTAGRRRVRVRFGIDPAGFDSLHQDFITVGRHAQPDATPLDLLSQGCRLWFSSAAGWHPVPIFTFALEQHDPLAPAPTLVLEFELAPDAPACVGNGTLCVDGQQELPSLRLVLEAHGPIYLYSFFARLKVGRIDFEVDVSGLAALVQAPTGPIAVGAPFAPFGALPQCGLGFTAGHPELRAKAVDRVQLRLLWLDLLQGEASIASHYDGYGLAFDDARFQVGVAGGIGKQWLPLAPGTLALFPDGYRETRLELLLAQPALLEGGVRVTLAAPAYAFGHRQFPTIFANQALATTAAMLDNKQRAGLFAGFRRPDGARPAAAPAPPPLPKTQAVAPASAERAPRTVAAPLTPMLAGVELDYRAHDYLVLAEAGDANSSDPLPGSATCHLLTPFGHSARGAELRGMMLSDEIDEGHLYLGFVCPQQPETLTLYVALLEKAASSSLAKLRPRFKWRYLARNVWHDFPSEYVRSETDGFSRSGLVHLRLPADITARHTLMPDRRYWIGISVDRGAEAISATVKIVPHAVAADRCAPLERPGFGMTLPAGSIAALATRVPAIVAVHQPFATSAGQPAETDQAFRARVSQRLRHRQRASQPADFEQLALELFPAIWQAKCSTFNNSAGYPATPRVAAGEVVLTVTPAAVVHGQPALLPLPLYLLNEVAARLRELSSPFIRRLVVRNAVLEEVKAIVEVRLRAGQGHSASFAQINRIINDTIAPWQAGPGRLIDLGCAQVHTHQLGEAIAAASCVDQLLHLALVHTSGQPAAGVRYIADGAAYPGSPWSVLVPARRHEIRTGPARPQTGIAGMTVGTDFHVRPASAPDPVVRARPRKAVQPV